MATQLAPGDEVRGYRVVSLIQDGGRSFAYKAEDKSGIPVFLKQFKSPVPRSPDGAYAAFMDYQNKLKARLESAKLVDKVYRSLDYFEFDPTHSGRATRNNYFQAFEFVVGKDLAKYLGEPSTTWKQRITFAKLLMYAMDAFHETKIVHCDLKPDNLFLITDSSIKTGYRFKVIDFDYTFMTDLTPPWIGHGEGYGGTPGYFSPEHIRFSQGEDVHPSSASDVYTCGLMLYELLTVGGHPYSFGSDTEYNEQMFGYAAPVPKLRESTGDASHDRAISEMLHRCLDPNPEKRPSAKDVQQCLIKNTESTIPPKPTPPLPLPPSVSSTLTLEGEGGTVKKYKLEANFGKVTAQTFGADGRFYADTQFSFEREGDDWFVVPARGTLNASILNGAKLEKRTKLKSGDVLAVGNLSKGLIKLPLRVRIG